MTSGEFLEGERMIYALQHAAKGAPATLVEMTASEFRHLPKQHFADGSGYRYVRLDWRTAHAWVKGRHPNNTALYLNSDGRIRRAGS